jgi:uncharacterized membrane protein
MAVYGYFRGGIKGVAMCAVGGALVARASANEELSDVLRSRGILVEKSIVVDAPVEQVFAYWRNLENLPQWMSHVREVRALGGDRYHWMVDGPAGMPVEWDSELLNYEENREMTWHSVGDSQVDNVAACASRKSATGRASTCSCAIRRPGVSRATWSRAAFGTDPKSEMDDDLARMKTAIETGHPPRDAGWRDTPPSLSHATERADRNVDGRVAHPPSPRASSAGNAGMGATTFPGRRRATRTASGSRR